MHKLGKRIFSVFFFLLAACFPTTIFAQSQFTVDALVKYEILGAESTQVLYEVSITNNVSTVFAKEYALQLNTGNVQQVAVVDLESQESLPFQSQSLNGISTITIQFPTTVVGKEAKRRFQVSFRQSDIAIEYGNVLEVNLPRLSDAEAFDAYRVEVVVPQKYGQASFVNPATFSEEVEEGRSRYVFEAGAKNGASLLFGTEQTYSFVLRYHAENSAVSVGQVQFALPPDTPYQRVTYLDIQPRPYKIEKDEDGNWIASFEIQAKERIEVVATGSVTVYLEPTVPVKDPEPRSEYLSAAQYWEKLDLLVFPSISSSKNQPILTRARVVYDTVINQLSYGFSRLEQGETTRLGVAGALESPSMALCQEYTDVFISLARSAGVHAREVNGYAFTTNPRFRPLSLVADVLHAWPEFYDPTSKTWISVDPTWGDTTGGVDYFSKLGFSHIAFIRRGLSSTSPFPAGVYKLPDEQTKDVAIEFGESVAVPPSFSIEKSGVLEQPSIRITNNTGASWYDQVLSVRSGDSLQLKILENDLKYDVDDGVQLDFLPYETKELFLNPEVSGFRLTQKSLVEFEFAGSTISYELIANRVPRWVIVASISGAVALGSGGLLVHLFGKRGALRRKSKKS